MRFRGNDAPVTRPSTARRFFIGLIADNFCLQHSYLGIFLLGHEPGEDLSMLLRTHAASHFAFARAVAALCLSYSGNPKRAAGQDFKTPRVPSRAGNGHYKTATKLDYLFAAEKTFPGTGHEPEMSSGLRAVESEVQI